MPLCWLDLRGSGLSVLERLLLEECLLRHEQESDGQPLRNWIVVGHHEPTRHRYLQVPIPRSANPHHNPSAVIVMGIGGKPKELLDLDLVKGEQVMTLKRFTGGGTVVLDHDSIYTTIIGRRPVMDKDRQETSETNERLYPNVEAFPRPIMQWSVDAIFGPLFDGLQSEQVRKSGAEDPPSTVKKGITVPAAGGGTKQTLVMDTKSCGMDNSGEVISIPVTQLDESNKSLCEGGSGEPERFALRENDYVLGERKMGGNAQSIVKSGWLHHTSFLWDFQPEHMDYLTLPSKRPDYRKDRSHHDFLVTLQRSYPNLQKNDFYAILKQVCEDAFDLETITIRQAMDVVNRKGGMQAWFEKGGRTRIVDHNSF